MGHDHANAAHTYGYSFSTYTGLTPVAYTVIGFRVVGLVLPVLGLGFSLA